HGQEIHINLSKNIENKVDILTQEQLKSQNKYLTGIFSEIRKGISDLGEDKTLIRLSSSIPNESIKHFIQKETLFKDIGEIFSKSNKYVIISGYAGSGKTTLASKYTHEQRDENKTVRWFNAESKDLVWNDYKNMATKELKIGNEINERQVNINLTFNTIAKLYLKTAKYHENKFCNFENLLKYHQKSLKILKTLYEGSDPLIANSLNKVGSIHHKLGNAEKGLAYFKQALEMRRGLYKVNHQDVATSLNNVGWSYATLNDAQKALEYKVRGLEMFRHLYTGSHPDVADALHNVRTGHYSLGNTCTVLE
ncbi:unnamed protein product, partial [Didymodactylos carnosus]